MYVLQNALLRLLIDVRKHALINVIKNAFLYLHVYHVLNVRLTGIKKNRMLHFSCEWYWISDF